MAADIVIQNNSTLLGPMLVASGAVIAAVLTVLTANWRHNKQLYHERRERNREHTRDTLDLAVVNAMDAIEQATGYDIDLRYHQKWLESQEEERSESRSDSKTEPATKAEGSTHDRQEREAKLTERLYKSWDTTQKMRTDNVRLELRLGPEHQITKAHEEIRKHLGEYRNVVGKHKGAEAPVVKKEFEATGRAFRRFRDACQAWFASDASD